MIVISALTSEQKNERVRRKLLIHNTVHARCFYAGVPWLTVDHSCLFILLGAA